MSPYSRILNSIWLPRVLTIGFILFLSLFSFDALTGPDSFGQKATGLIIHLIPSLTLLFVLILSWKDPLRGGIIFILLGIASIFFFHTYKVFSSFMIVSLPLFIIGVLFIMNRPK